MYRGVTDLKKILNVPRRHRFRNNSYFFVSFPNETWEKLQVLFQHYFQVRADGHSIPVLLEAILQLLPLDTYVYAPVCCFLSLWPLLTWPLQVMLMDLVNKDKNSGMPEPPVWATYQGLLDSSEGKKVRLFLINHHSSSQTTWYPGGGDPSGEVWVLQAGQGSLCSCPYWRDGALWQHNTPERRAENMIHCTLYIWTQCDWHLETFRSLTKMRLLYILGVMEPTIPTKCSLILFLRDSWAFRQ